MKYCGFNVHANTHVAQSQQEVQCECKEELANNLETHIEGVPAREQWYLSSIYGGDHTVLTFQSVM